MYADRAARSMRVNPASFTAAIAINGALLAALIYANPEWVTPILPEPPITLIDVKPFEEPVPPPEPLEPIQDRPIERVFVPKTIITTTQPTKTEFVFTDAPTPPIAGEGTGPVIAPYDPPKPPVPMPVLTGAVLDGRFARDFQPEYPPGQQRLEAEGRVVVRVLIGTDGRVREVEQVSATNDEFFGATKRRALARWRFKPATRDGVPVETWKTINVRFEIKT